MSKPPSPPRASNGFSVMVCSWSWRGGSRQGSVVRDLLDHAARRARAGAARCRPARRSSASGSSRCASASERRGRLDGLGVAAARVAGWLARAAATDSGGAAAARLGAAGHRRLGGPVGRPGGAACGRRRGLVGSADGAGRLTAGGATGLGCAHGSTIASTRQSVPTTSIAAWRRISSLPPPTKESRAPALAKPTVRLRAVDADDLGVLAEQDPGAAGAAS